MPPARPAVQSHGWRVVTSSDRPRAGGVELKSGPVAVSGGGCRHAAKACSRARSLVRDCRPYRCRDRGNTGDVAAAAARIWTGLDKPCQERLWRTRRPVPRLNEGYLATGPDTDPVRHDLTAEAIRLTRLIRVLLPDGEVAGLLARAVRRASVRSIPVVASYRGRDRSLRGAADRLEKALTAAGIEHDVKE